MKRMIVAALFSTLAIAAFGQIPAVSVPNSFSAGNAISASEMNANFAALVQAVKDEVQPIGTVIASFVAPDAGGDYMSGTGNQVWAFADGSKPTGVTFSPFPDLRGQFLRGMDRSGGADPDTRAVGSTQVDALQAHRHDLVFTPGGAGGPLGISVATSVATISQTGYSGWAGDGRFASETRPTNIAVYWYIKVK